VINISDYLNDTRVKCAISTGGRTAITEPGAVPRAVPRGINHGGQLLDPGCATSRAAISA